MMRNFWYAVSRSTALRKAPVSVRVLGKDLVLYRNAAGKVAALNDRCAHRGDRLSRGLVEGDCIRCPYHHWAYNQAGQCTDIPSGGDIPARARVTAYDTLEQNGWVHVFMGDLANDQRPPVPLFPELQDPAWHTFDFELTLDAHYSRVVENAIDLSHLPFLHRESYGPEQPHVNQLLDHEHNELSGSGAYEHATRAPGALGWFAWSPIPSRTAFTWHLPCFTSTRAVTQMGTLLLVMCHLPVDDGHTRILYRLARDFYRAPMLDWMFKDASVAVFEEDRRSVNEQWPRRAPLDPSDEVAVAADALPLAFRRARRQAYGRGWGVEEDR